MLFTSHNLIFMFQQAVNASYVTGFLNCCVGTLRGLQGLSSEKIAQHFFKYVMMMM